MAAADHTIVQPPPQEAVAGAIPPVPENAPAGPAEAQPPAGVVEALAHQPQNAVPPNPPGAQVVAWPVGAVIPAAGLLGLGVSPLHRSLYGWLPRN